MLMEAIKSEGYGFGYDWKIQDQFKGSSKQKAEAVVYFSLV